MAAANVAEHFGRMIALGLARQKQLALEKQRAEIDAAISAKCAKYSDKKLKRIWDEWDDDNVGYDTYGITIDELHRELNIRGHGEYCAV